MMMVTVDRIQSQFEAETIRWPIQSTFHSHFAPVHNIIMSLWPGLSPSTITSGLVARVWSQIIH